MNWEWSTLWHGSSCLITFIGYLSCKAQRCRRLWDVPNPAAPSPLIAHTAAKNDSGNLATMTEQCVAMKTFAKLPATSSPILCERAWSNILVTTHYGTQPGSDFSCVERACLWRGGLPPVGLRSSPSKHTAFLQEDLHGRFGGCCAARRGTSPLATNSITLTKPPHSPTTVKASTKSDQSS